MENLEGSEVRQETWNNSRKEPKEGKVTELGEACPFLQTYSHLPAKYGQVP